MRTALGEDISSNNEGFPTCAGRVKGRHVEDIDTLDLSEKFETLETGGLIDVGGDGAGRGTGSDKVGSVLDL